MTPALLEADEAAPVELFHENGRGPFVIVCDHAGSMLPRSVGTLGLSADDLRSHIAWDIGAAAVARKLALALDSALVLQRYSRLIIDCNRPLSAPDSMPEQSGGIVIPGNRELPESARAARVRDIFEPYHASIAALVAAPARARYTLITVHSFTPELYGVPRPFHCGVLYHRDTRLAAPLLALLRQETGLIVGDNEPYAASPQSDFAIIEYGERRGAPYVELEVRQDLVADEAGQNVWAQRFARLLRIASASFHY